MTLTEFIKLPHNAKIVHSNPACSCYLRVAVSPKIVHSNKVKISVQFVTKASGLIIDSKTINIKIDDLQYWSIHQNV